MSSENFTAFILCDSHNRALSPLVSESRPLALLSLGNRPLIDTTLDMLAQNGVSEVIVLAHSGFTAIDNYIQHGVLPRPPAESTTTGTSPQVLSPVGVPSTSGNAAALGATARWRPMSVRCMRGDSATVDSVGGALRQLLQANRVPQHFLTVPIDAIFSSTSQPFLREFFAQHKASVAQCQSVLTLAMSSDYSGAMVHDLPERIELLTQEQHATAGPKTLHRRARGRGAEVSVADICATEEDLWSITYERGAGSGHKLRGFVSYRREQEQAMDAEAARSHKAELLKGSLKGMSPSPRREQDTLMPNQDDVFTAATADAKHTERGTVTLAGAPSLNCHLYCDPLPTDKDRNKFIAVRSDATFTGIFFATQSFVSGLLQSHAVVSSVHDAVETLLQLAETSDDSCGLYFLGSPAQTTPQQQQDSALPSVMATPMARGKQQQSQQQGASRSIGADQTPTTAAAASVADFLVSLFPSGGPAGFALPTAVVAQADPARAHIEAFRRSVAPVAWAFEPEAASRPTTSAQRAPKFFHIRSVASYIAANVAVCSGQLFSLPKETPYYRAYRNRPSVSVFQEEAETERLIEEDCEIGPNVVLAEAVSIGTQSRIVNSVIGPHVTLEPRVVVRNCVIYGRVMIGSDSVLDGCIIGDGVVVARGSVLRRNVVGDSAYVAHARVGARYIDPSMATLAAQLGGSRDDVAFSHAGTPTSPQPALQDSSAAAAAAAGAQQQIDMMRTRHMQLMRATSMRHMDALAATTSGFNATVPPLSTSALVAGADGGASGGTTATTGAGAADPLSVTTGGVTPGAAAPVTNFVPRAPCIEDTTLDNALVADRGIPTDVAAHLLRAPVCEEPEEMDEDQETILLHNAILKHFYRTVADRIDQQLQDERAAGSAGGNGTESDPSSARGMRVAASVMSLAGGNTSSADGSILQETLTNGGGEPSSPSSAAQDGSGLGVGFLTDAPLAIPRDQLTAWRVLMQGQNLDNPHLLFAAVKGLVVAVGGAFSTVGIRPLTPHMTAAAASSVPPVPVAALEARQASTATVAPTAATPDETRQLLFPSLRDQDNVSPVPLPQAPAVTLPTQVAHHALTQLLGSGSVGMYSTQNASVGSGVPPSAQMAPMISPNNVTGAPTATPVAPVTGAGGATGHRRTWTDDDRFNAIRVLRQAMTTWVPTFFRDMMRDAATEPEVRQRDAIAVVEGIAAGFGTAEGAIFRGDDFGPLLLDDLVRADVVTDESIMYVHHLCKRLRLMAAVCQERLVILKRQQRAAAAAADGSRTPGSAIVGHASTATNASFATRPPGSFVSKLIRQTEDDLMADIESERDVLRELIDGLTQVRLFGPTTDVDHTVCGWMHALAHHDAAVQAEMESADDDETTTSDDDSDDDDTTSTSSSYSGTDTDEAASTDAAAPVQATPVTAVAAQRAAIANMFKRDGDSDSSSDDSDSDESDDSGPAAAATVAAPAAPARAAVGPAQQQTAAQRAATSFLARSDDSGDDSSDSD